jgi:hypothetical protein
LGIDGGQNYGEVIVRKHLMHIDAEYGRRKLHRALKKAPDLVMTFIVASEGAMTWNVPSDSRVECGEDRGDVTLCKSS